MKVKAKWAIKVNGKWHNATEVFDVDSLDGLENAVEVIEEPKQVRMEEAVPEKPEVPADEPEAEPKPRAATRTRRKISDK